MVRRGSPVRVRKRASIYEHICGACFRCLSRRRGAPPNQRRRRGRRRRSPQPSQRNGCAICVMVHPSPQNDQGECRYEEVRACGRALRARLRARRAGVGSRSAARLRAERRRVHAVDAAVADTGDARLDFHAASVEPVRPAALRRLVRARHVRQRAEPARVPARLLHPGRRPRRDAEWRRDQRRRGRLQPVRRLSRVRWPDQLLAIAVELDAERDAAEQARPTRRRTARTTAARTRTTCSASRRHRRCAA